MLVCAYEVRLWTRRDDVDMVKAGQDPVGCMSSGGLLIFICPTCRAADKTAAEFMECRVYFGARGGSNL